MDVAIHGVACAAGSLLFLEPSHDFARFKEWYDSMPLNMLLVNQNVDMIEEATSFPSPFNCHESRCRGDLQLLVETGVCLLQ